MKATGVLQAQPTETKINSGVVREDRAMLAKHLESGLANSYLLYLKTQNFHWNVVGPMFYSLHKLTEAQYEDLADAIDAVAERIRATGFTAPGSFTQFKAIASIEEESGKPSAEDMVMQLADDNETCSRVLREAVRAAEEVGDVKTADLLTERIGRHEENTWMLRAMLAG